MLVTIATATNADGSPVVNMTIAKGESVSESVTISNGSVPLNLTGYTLKMTIAFASPLLLSTDNGGITITNATAGICQINVTDTVSGAFATGAFSYDFWMIIGTTATRLFSGTFNVLGSITAIP